VFYLNPQAISIFLLYTVHIGETAALVICGGVTIHVVDAVRFGVLTVQTVHVGETTALALVIGGAIHIGDA
jgi:hypothetical protein